VILCFQRLCKIKILN